MRAHVASSQVIGHRVMAQGSRPALAAPSPLGRRSHTYSYRAVRGASRGSVAHLLAPCLRRASWVALLDMWASPRCRRPGRIPGGHRVPHGRPSREGSTGDRCNVSQHRPHCKGSLGEGCRFYKGLTFGDSWGRVWNRARFIYRGREGGVLSWGKSSRIAHLLRSCE